MDSSEMTPKGELGGCGYHEHCRATDGWPDKYGMELMIEWNDIAKLVEENWELYDGFIILSGTDTLVSPQKLTIIQSIPDRIQSPGTWA
jgi:hypothetical protein